MKRIVLYYMMVFTVISFILPSLPTAGESEIYSDVIRLHILASSDTAEDQARKIAVRDAILAEYGARLSEVKSRDEAEETVKALLPAVRETAERTLRKNGSAETVTVTLSEEYYGRRNYKDFAMPAGTYLSLSVKIASGEGQNFFCVLYPPLCLDSALADSEIPVGLTPEEYRLITGESEGYRVKFKMLELFSSLFE